MLYMFQAVPPPIIRSSELYTQHRVFVEILLLLTAIVSELGLTHDSGKIKYINYARPHERKEKTNVINQFTSTG